MNTNLDIIAKELYGKIQTRFQDIQMGDENAKVLSKKEDIPKARFFEFEYDEGGESLGTVAITLDEDDGVVVQVSGELVDGANGVPRHRAYKFIRSFRQFAKDRLLKFDIQNLGKSNLDKRDYHFQAKRKEIPMEPIMESKLYGTTKMSYQDLGEATLIIRHSQPINPELAAGRTMHIESIYVENAHGERFRYPSKHLNGARALAEHIKAGGNPYDSIGKHICSLSEELAGLRKFKNYVSRQEQISEAMGNVTNRVLERIEEIKKQVQMLQRPAYYESFAEAFEDQEEQMIPEEIANDLIDRLTIRTFNEDLKAIFPYIYKFVDESELPVLELDADDLLDEAGDGSRPHGMTTDWHKRYQEHKSRHDDYVDSGDHANADKAGKTARLAAQEHHKETGKKIPGAEQFDVYENLQSADESLDLFADYESAIDRLMEQDDLFSPNKSAQQSAIEKFNDVMSQELKPGPGGVNAVESLKGLIDDPELMDELKKADPELDVRALIQQWIYDNTDKFDAPEIVNQLKFSGSDTTPTPTKPAPIANEPLPAEPLPATPTAGGTPPVDGALGAEAGGAPAVPPPAGLDTAAGLTPPPDQTTPVAEGIMNALRKAKAAGATLETQLDFGYGVKTIGEIIEDCGCAPHDVGYDAEPTEPEAGGLDAMLKYISGFYSKEEGNFPLGGTRIKIKVKKEFDDGAFPDASEDDLMKLMQFIEKKDPSSNEHDHIIKLAGVRSQGHQMPSGHMEMNEWHLKDMEDKIKKMKECMPSMDDHHHEKIKMSHQPEITADPVDAEILNPQHEGNDVRHFLRKLDQLGI